MEKNEFIQWLRANLNTKVASCVILVMISTMTVGCYSLAGIHIPASGKTQVVKPVSGNLGKYKIMALYSKDSSSQPSSDEEYLSLLDGLIVGKIRNMKLFEKVYSLRATVETEYDLKVDVTIIKSKKVDADKRRSWGLFAGRAGFEAEISLIDSKTGTIIGTAKAEGKSSAGHATSGETSQAVEYLADEVIAFIVQNL